jgi:hypothetical protein
MRGKGREKRREKGRKKQMNRWMLIKIMFAIEDISVKIMNTIFKY